MRNKVSKQHGSTKKHQERYETQRKREQRYSGVARTARKYFGSDSRLGGTPEQLASMRQVSYRLLML